MLLIAMLLACASCASMPEPPTSPKFGALRITIATEITAGVADRIEAALDAAPARWLVLYLDSPGGDFQAARRIAHRIAAAPRSVAIVKDGRRCASSCTVLWAAADERLVGSAARFGFHGVDCGGGLLCRMRQAALDAKMRDWISRASPSLVALLDGQDPPAFKRYGGGERNIVRLTGEQIITLKAARAITPGAEEPTSVSAPGGLTIEALDPLDGSVRQASPGRGPRQPVRSG
jgi:ClpP protease-like protein